jgi:diacylglycerol kinase (ATP)
LQALRLRFLVNPAAGAGRGGRALSRLQAEVAGPGVEIEVSRGAEHLSSLARRAAEEGVDRVVAVGGDGTFHHVIRGLVGSDCELGLLPMGTGNDLAAIAGIPQRWEDALRLAVEGSAKAFDLGELTAPGGERTPFGVYCGGGLDSEVSKWARERPGREGGRFVYLLGALVVLRSFRPPLLTVEHDSGRFEGRAMLAVAANGYRFGGGMKVAPDADPRDGLFDLVIVRELPAWRALPLLAKVYFGSHVGHPAVEILRTGRARITSDRALPLAVDGEGAGELGPQGIELALRPGALRLVVP